MERSTLKTLFFLILGLWIPTFVELFSYEEHMEEKRNEVCNVSNHGRLYIFEDNMRCCKEKALKFLEPSSTECGKQIGKDNPDDDVATYMWKAGACKYKAAMDLKEDKLDYKTFVKFMSTNYTTFNNIQGMIRDKITKCPEGDTETTFYKKFQAYYLCFFKNEQEICEDPSPKGIEYKTKYLAMLKDSMDNSSKTCKPFPGALAQQSLCCKGETTPILWQNEPLRGYSHWDEAKNADTRECRTNIRDLYPPNRMAYGEKLTPWDEYDHSNFDCFDACVRNPVLFQNGSTTAPKLVFDFNKTLEIYAGKSSLPSSVVNDLKDIAFRRKSSLKMGFTADDYEKETGITFNDIETKFATLSDQKLQVKYYCNYYKNVRSLFEVAITEHCASEASFKAHLKHQTRMPH